MRCFSIFPHFLKNWDLVVLYLTIWAWRRREGKGRKGGVSDNQQLNYEAVCRAAPGFAWVC